MEPVGEVIQRRRAEGVKVELLGVSTDGKRWLVRWTHNDTDVVTIAPINGYTEGRWECEGWHYDQHRDLYAARFPYQLAG